LPFPAFDLFGGASGPRRDADYKSGDQHPFSDFRFHSNLSAFFPREQPSHADIPSRRIEA
jgi:hypothetical protein